MMRPSTPLSSRDQFYVFHLKPLAACLCTRMKRRITGYLLCLAFILAVWCLFGAFEGEPRYQGKTVDEWRLALDFPETRTRAVDALLHLGTNQTPAIIKKLLTQDSRFKEKWFDLLNRQPLIKFTFTPAFYRQWEGLDALSSLGPGARAALPALTNLLRNPDPNVVFTATEAVRNVGPPGVPALINQLGTTNLGLRSTILGSLGYLCQRADTQISEVYGVVSQETIARAVLPYLTSSDPGVSKAAFWAAGQLRGQRQIIIPAFLSGLTNSNSNVRLYAVQCVDLQGKDARPAVPLLLQLLHDPVMKIREAATNSLLKIDPEAAARAGIK